MEAEASVNRVRRVRFARGDFADVPERCYAAAFGRGDAALTVRRLQPADTFEDGVLLRGVLLAREEAQSVYSCGGLFVRLTEDAPCPDEARLLVNRL